MKILIVSHSFAPYNSVGTVRVAKMAKYLARAGHELRVLTATPHSLPTGLPREIPAEWVQATRWINLRAPAERFGAGPGSDGAGAGAPRGLRARGRAAAWSVYRQVVGYPDLMVGWVPYALRAGVRLCREWRPEVIYASAPPYSTLLLASLLSRRVGIPWVAELRDLWVDTHHYPYSALRRAVERRTERAVLSTAAGLVTVSDPLAARLRSRYRVPVQVVMNGFDPEDVPAPRARSSGGPLRLVYTGSAHATYQDPSMLLAAIAGSPELVAGVTVELYGPRLGFARELAEKQGIGGNVRVYGPVPYAEALALQRGADALLLLLWNDPEQTGVLTGKLFEYLGARRPILALGPHPEEAGRLVRELGAGSVARSAAEARVQLLTWLRQKRAGELLDLPESTGSGLTREAQAGALADFLARVAL